VWAADSLRGPSLLTRFFERAGVTQVYVSALLVALGYYAGAKIGLGLTFSPHPVSLLWLPNAILAAGLLLTPARSWYILLIAALPAHILAELPKDIPLPMVLCWFISNVSEALIAVVSLRWLLGRSLFFDRVEDVGVFILCGAFLAPFISSFIDAAFVRLVGWGEVGYREVWRVRFTSNVLSALTIVPFIINWANAGWHSLREMLSNHLTELVLLLCGLSAASLLVFAVPRTVAEVMPELLYLPLPFLLWAAVRFGPIGGSTAFLMVSLLVIWGAGHGRGPFLGGSPSENALSVQLFLSFAAVTLLTLSASVQERRNSERHLQRNEERFGLVLRATNDTIFDCDIVANRLWWNANGEIFFGKMSDDHLATSAAWFGLVHPDDKERLKRRFQAAMDRGEETFQAEYRLQQLGGKYAYVHARGFIVRDEAGKPVRVIGSLTDITDRKHAEEANRQLAHVSRLAVVGELTASIGHEINQPLSAILINVESADALLDNEVIQRDELKRIMEDIRHDDMRAVDVVRHMRALLKKRNLAMQPFDLNHAIRDVLILINADLTRHRVTVETEFAPSLPMVHGDQVHLQQVMLNLILNAVEAMSDMPAAAKRLGVQTRSADGNGVAVTVWDSGPGIVPGRASSIFESFFTTKPDGMGLGLSIARSIIEAHGGTIWANTRPEGGASFSFLLPEPPSEQTARSERIL
jgi:two-component system, LuxR family, sensor kinase FixL